MLRMRNQYPISLTALVVASSLALSAHGQKAGMLNVQRPQPTSSTPVKLTDFARPPHPIEIVSMNLTSGGVLRYQTLMPIDGRMFPTTEAGKLKGAITGPPEGVCIYTNTVDAAGQAAPTGSMVFGTPDPRVKVAPGASVDWVVWGTNSDDGPLRLPYGGKYDQLPTAAQPTRQLRQVSFVISGSGLNYANYGLYPRYRMATRYVDPVSTRFVSRSEEMIPQQAANEQKLARYIAVEGETPWQRGQVIDLSPSTDPATGPSRPRFEGVATRFVEGDKNASVRQVSLLTFDDAGNLLNDQAVSFPYNRKLSMRLPVQDATGQTVGTFSVFADGGGKKDGRDPEENRFSVVVTNQDGSVWSQFEWVNGEGSSRAVIPTYVLRKGDNLLVYNTNQQKLLKPVEETWLFDKSGKASLVGSVPNGEIAGRSTQVIDSPTGVVSGGQRIGWANYSGAHYIDSFTDANGEVWLLLQRQADAPGGSSVSASAPAPTSTTSRLMGFANKLNQMTGQSAPAQAATPQSTESGKVYSDLFVLHFDADLKFKEQTVINLDAMPEPVRFQRSIRSTGSDYVLSNATNTRLSMRNGQLSVQRLAPLQAVGIVGPQVNNFVLDPMAGTIYVLYGIPKKPGVGQLLTYSLD